jgi:hypothetical protein
MGFHLPVASGMGYSLSFSYGTLPESQCAMSVPDINTSFFWLRNNLGTPPSFDDEPSRIFLMGAGGALI